MAKIIMQSTITHHFVSSFVRRVTYPKISPIGLHLAEKTASKVVTVLRLVEQEGAEGEEEEEEEKNMSTLM